MANKFKILRHGNSVVFSLRSNFFVRSEVKTTAEATISRGAKHVSEDSTIIAIVLAALISVLCLDIMASSIALIFRYWMMEVKKIQPCISSITAHGKMTAIATSAINWRMTGSNRVVDGILVRVRQPCNSSSSSLLFDTFSDWDFFLDGISKNFGNTPSNVPATHTKPTATSIRLVVTRDGYLK